MNSSAARLNSTERTLLLGIARQAIAEHVRSGQLPEVDEARLPGALLEARACFVTLHKHNQLRGCIGNLAACEPLFRAVINHALGSAFRDSRFSPVTAAEVSELEMEVSVLTEPMPLAFASVEALLAQLRPDVDGVVLKVEGKAATFLPQVWEMIPEPADFMDQLALKAGLSRTAWRSSDARVLTYQVESFAEKTRGSMHDQEREASQHGDDEARDQSLC
ncbi:MAG: hypothetical protein RLY20_17 [Verrucomicrobiota bacterium]|jgi:AmmeMemoRadiSam system protein A